MALRFDHFCWSQRQNKSYTFATLEKRLKTYLRFLSWFIFLKGSRSQSQRVLKMHNCRTLYSQCPKRLHSFPHKYARLIIFFKPSEMRKSSLLLSISLLLDRGTTDDRGMICFFRVLDWPLRHGFAIFWGSASVCSSIHTISGAEYFSHMDAEVRTSSSPCSKFYPDPCDFLL